MKVAVYGTLKKGFGNHQLLESSKFIKKDFIAIDAVTSRGFPMAKIADKSQIYLACEVYEIDDETLIRLDQLEGEGVLYKRLLTETQSGEVVYAYHIIARIHSIDGVEYLRKDNENNHYYSWPSYTTPDDLARRE